MRPATVVLALLLVACGGGGGGGGSGGGGDGSGDAQVLLKGIAFQLPDGTVVHEPPESDPMASPPQLGAPLNLVILFRFNGLPTSDPAGANATNLPIFTAPGDADPALHLTDVTPAKGSYELVFREVTLPDLTTADPHDTVVVEEHVVEFRPFVPTTVLDATTGAPPGAVPGLLPGSTYTARVMDEQNLRLPNLQVGGGGEVRFTTTAQSALYYPALESAADQPPVLVASDPPEGTVDFYPGLLSEVALGASEPTVVAGPSDILLTYDRALLPTVETLAGPDLDGDGQREPSFVLRARGTRLLVTHTVPADVLGDHEPFAALSAFQEGGAGADGSQVIVHGGDALPDPLAALDATPLALCPGRDPQLLYMTIPTFGQPDRLMVVDQLVGDPSAATVGPQSVGNTGLYDVRALATLADGRLMAWDDGTNRLVELRLEVQRHRASPGVPAGPPEVLDLWPADGSDGFRSEAYPSGVTVLDLAPMPDGRLAALVERPTEPRPVLLCLAPPEIGVEGGGLPLPSDDEALLYSFETQVTGVEFDGPDHLLVLDRERDSLLRIALADGSEELLVADVSGFGVAVPDTPDGFAPATGFTVGQVDFDVEVEMLANGSGPEGSSVLRVRPLGLLPFDADLTLLQRRTLASLEGGSQVTADPTGGTSRGFVELLHLRTSAPTAGLGERIDDAFVEDFEDDAYEDPAGNGLSPVAEWAEPAPSGVRASVGVPEGQVLGDFLPQPFFDFDPEDPFGRTPIADGDPDLQHERSDLRVILLDTDSQQFPLLGGATPGLTSSVTVEGGVFVFRDVIVPPGVRIVARGSKPLVLTATRRMEFHGVLDARGGDGYSDDSFDTGFLPLAGGAGGPAAGRGGDGHPTLFDPRFGGTINQFVTPETGERGFGPVVDAMGRIGFEQVGGHGGLSTLGYIPTVSGVPKFDAATNTEYHRPPGGGGGSLYFRGDRSHDGAGTYRVQSNSTWSPYTRCPLDDKITAALYGNDENIAQGLEPSHKLQCVYMQGTPENPVRIQPGADPGVPLFVDGDLANDFVGPGGEMPVLHGGQGGGGGGSRIDSMKHRDWASGIYGEPAPFGPPYYPVLAGPPAYSPTRFDSKGAGGGGGGGAVVLRSFGDLVLGRTARIDASGGHGGGSERLQTGSTAGGGGGGSGGVIVVQAGGSLTIRADPDHITHSYTGKDGEEGAALDVSGGFGRDSGTDPLLAIVTSYAPMKFEASRSDGGSGGFGLIQLQEGGDDTLPVVEEGAYLFARQRAMVKQGLWSGGSAFDQASHPSWQGLPPYPPDILRYIDVLHYRGFQYEPGGLVDHYLVLNGSHPPTILSATGDNGSGDPNEYPVGSGQRWFDTAVVGNPLDPEGFLVREPQPEVIMKTYNGYGPDYVEINNPPDHPSFPDTPGTTYRDDSVPIPLSVGLKVPDGTPYLVEVDGKTIVDPAQTVDRLPLVPPQRAPPPFGAVSRGVSRWLDFNGALLRERSAAGLTPPRFEPFHGTFNAAWSEATGSQLPDGLEGLVRVGAEVPDSEVKAHYVANTGPDSFDPGLFGWGAGQEIGPGGPPDPPYNDVKVDAPELLATDVVTDNATVGVLFQGAHPVRAGSHVPDPETLSAWVSDPRELDGHALVRFQVVFDLAAQPEQSPFGLDSARPLVDEVRLRLSY